MSVERITEDGKIKQRRQLLFILIKKIHPGEIPKSKRVGVFNAHRNHRQSM